MRRNKPEILIRPSLLFLLLLLLLLLSVQLVRDDDLPVAVAASARPAWRKEEGVTFSLSEPPRDWISHCEGEPTSNLSTSSNSMMLPDVTIFMNNLDQI